MKQEKKESITASVVKNSFWNFLTVLFAKIGGLIFTIIIARYLLPEKFGIYSLAMSITLILLTFADLGINQTLIRYFSESYNSKNKGFALLQYKYLLKFKLLLTLFFAFMLMILSYPLSVYIFNKPLLFLPLIFSSFYLIVSAIESFYESFFFVVKKVEYLTIKQFFWEILRNLIVLLVFLLIAGQYQVIGVISVMILSTLFALIFVLYSLKRVVPFLFSKQKAGVGKLDKLRINKFLIYLSIGSALLMIFAYVDSIQIGIFLPSEYVGYYTAAFSFIGGLCSLITIANVLLPVFTQLRKRQLNKFFEKIFRYTSLIAIPMAFGIIVLAKFIIVAVYGYDYLPAVLPLYFLAFLILETPLTNNLKSLFSAKENLKYFVIIISLATFMNIILNFILITSLSKFSLVWGMTGAAISTLVTRYFYLIILSLYTKKETGIRFNFVYILKPLFASIIMASVLFFINSNIPQMTLPIGIGEIILGILIYFSVLFLIKGIKKQDFLLIKQLIK